MDGVGRSYFAASRIWPHPHLGCPHYPHCRRSPSVRVALDDVFTSHGWTAEPTARGSEALASPELRIQKMPCKSVIAFVEPSPLVGHGINFRSRRDLPAL